MRRGSDRGAASARLLAATLAAGLSLGAGVAHGQTGGVSGDGGTGPDSGEEPAPGGSSARLTLAETKPRKAWLAGPNAVLRYRLEGASADLRIEVVQKGSGEVVRSYRRPSVPAGERQRLAWNGKDADKDFVRQGKYRFRIRDASGAKVDNRNAEGRQNGFFYKHKFPVRGRHQYWDGFGAGRGHKGQDVGARCGTKLVAARGGKVQWRAYDGGGGGYYVVIDGKKTKRDYVYMHLKRRASVRKGERVRTGEKIGKVGESGNASGCHLHFEIWKGDWWNGGKPTRRVTRALKRWDSWS